MPQPLIEYLRSRGLKVKEYFKSAEQLMRVLPRLDFLYMTRLQRERFEDEAEYYKARDMFRFFLHMMQYTKEGFGVGHPLPLDKSFPSILPNVKKHPKYWAKRQMGNGVPTRAVEMAFSTGLAGHSFNGQIWVPEEISDVFYSVRPKGKPKPGRGRRRKAKKRRARDIRPIENGTVIDHIEDNPYVISRIVQLLGCEERRNRYRSGVVEPIDRPGETKGVLMINDRYLSDDEVRLVATIAPGATVNYISNRRVKRKLDLFLPGTVEGLPGMNCTNTRCVSRPDQGGPDGRRHWEPGEVQLLQECYAQLRDVQEEQPALQEGCLIDVFVRR
jgi:aspartate carbamoyltransferase regulatory subunit